jgi:hypothetical protein
LSAGMLISETTYWIPITFSMEMSTLQVLGKLNLNEFQKNGLSYNKQLVQDIMLDFF